MPKLASGISICICTYNGQDFLASQVDSIVHQMTPADELIFVDDASKDATAAIARSYAALMPTQIRVYVNPKNRGPGANFAAAAAHAQREVIVFADQDDVWLDGRLARIRGVMERPNVFLYHGNALLVDAALQSIGSSWSQHMPKFFEESPLVSLLACFVRRSPAVGCMMAFRSPKNKNLFYWGMRVAPMHDLFLVAYAALNGNDVFIDRTETMLYRRHPKAATATGTIADNGRFTWKALKYRLVLFFSVFGVQAGEFCAQPVTKLQRWRSSYWATTRLLPAGSIRSFDSSKYS